MPQPQDLPKLGEIRPLPFHVASRFSYTPPGTEIPSGLSHVLRPRTLPKKLVTWGGPVVRLKVITGNQLRALAIPQ